MEIEKHIIDGCIRHDRRSQFKLYEHSYPYMMSIALRYRKDQNEAAAVINMAFLKVLNHLKNFDANQSIRAWMRRILINTIIDEFRKDGKIRKWNVNTDFDKEISMNGIHVDYNDAESNLHVEQLTEYIHQLNPLTANVFNLFVLDGYSHKDVGDLLEISEAASKWHLFTARKQLQEKIIQMQRTNESTVVSNIKIKEYEK
ncbi:MAG: sigma-70 family RNA polymerase sigma factor [Saprospiraceae bacterium]